MFQLWLAQDKQLINEKIEQLNKGVKETTQKQERLQGKIEKNLWRQEQEQQKLDQIEEDLKVFNEEFNSEQEKFTATLTNKDFYEKQQELNRAREAERRKKTDDLFSDVSRQLGKDENKWTSAGFRINLIQAIRPATAWRGSNIKYKPG